MNDCGRCVERQSLLVSVPVDSSGNPTIPIDAGTGFAVRPFDTLEAVSPPTSPLKLKQVPINADANSGSDGEIEAVKHPQDGAGILTSLTETDGLLEFPEDVTAIEPGARVGFLSYATLIG